MPTFPAPPRALALVVLAYVTALLAAWEALHCASSMPPLMAIFLAETVATAVVFGWSRAFDNSSFYDPFWSVGPMVLAAWLPFSPLAGVLPVGPRPLLMLGVTVVWGGRLTYNWLRGWEGLAHEDWRYVAFRKRFPRGYWAVSFVAIHFFPTVCTSVGSLPIWITARSSAPLGALDVLGVSLALGAVVIEGVADSQLRTYRETKAKKQEPGGICDVGLWAWSRHPNYFGECTFWVSVWIFGVAASPKDAVWTAASPLLIIALFVFGTIPLMEKRSLERRASYAEHQRRVARLFPWPPRNKHT